MIFGKVQGVGFRAFSQSAARALELTGWTRNLKDGRVEILATGEKQNLEDFEKILRRGPPHATVDKLEAEFVAWDGKTQTDFILLADGES